MAHLVFDDDTGVSVYQFAAPGGEHDATRDRFQLSVVGEDDSWHFVTLTHAQWYALCERIQSGWLP